MGGWRQAGTTAAAKVVGDQRRGTEPVIGMCVTKLLQPGQRCKKSNGMTRKNVLSRPPSRQTSIKHRPRRRQRSAVSLLLAQQQRFLAQPLQLLLLLGLGFAQPLRCPVLLLRVGAHTGRARLSKRHVCPLQTCAYNRFGSVRLQSVRSGRTEPNRFMLARLDREKKKRENFFA